MKKLFLILTTSLILAGCASNTPENDGISIVATSYFTYDFAKAITKEDNVTLLILPGEDAHSFEPTVKDMVTLEASDLLIYTNDDMEPWVASQIGVNINKLDASENITYLSSDHDHDHHHDPHTWTSMKNAITMVKSIRDAIIAIDPDASETYQTNAQALIGELETLDAEYENVFTNANIEPLIFLGHFGLNYLMHDYHFEYIALFESMSHESEPTIEQLTTIIDTINAYDLQYVFVEELSGLKIVETIKEETGVTALELNAMHNISKEQYTNGVTFVEIQKENIKNLRTGLVK
ncbi:MAG: zinc ABC transporter solute-binding protein [Erysipelothrix sp.]|nr:zinc ABC transporter solute-binding protein [Erysipelothrix sp.]